MRRARHSPTAGSSRIPIAAATGVVMLLLAAGQALAAPPEIRLSERNRVPACVTPERLMQFTLARNPEVAARFRDIAVHYRRHGEAWRVRWDYAYFQMLLETNYLSFRRRDGRAGDVDARQNNFAGLGATGDVPGDSFPDVATGVLAQLQHLVVYSGERLERPLAPRTRLKMDEIVGRSRALGRPVTFADLSRRWAVDSGYARLIEAIADAYRDSYCTPGNDEQTVDVRRPLSRTATRPGEQAEPRKPPPAATAAVTAPVRPQTPAETSAPQPPAVKQPAGACRVFTASYGDGVAVLLAAEQGATTHYTVLEVVPARRESQVRAYIDVHARGGAALGEFKSREDALAMAFALCPKE